jgi:hypothetical protein
MADSKSDLQFHPLSSFFPLIEGPEFQELVADIRKRGLEDPITLHEGKILDGRNRYRACREAGIEPRFNDYAGHDPSGFVISKNVFRRHLTTAQKLDLIEKLLIADPTRSDRATATLLGVDHKTVGAVRIEAEASGDIPQTTRRVDVKGRSRPARASRTPAPSVSAISKEIKSTSAKRDQGIVGFAEWMRSSPETELARRLEELLRVLADEKKRIAAIPQAKRVALARGLVDVLAVSAKDLAPILPRLNGG